MIATENALALPAVPPIAQAGGTFDFAPWIIGAVVLLVIGGIVLFLVNRRRRDEPEDGDGLATRDGADGDALEARDGLADAAAASPARNGASAIDRDLPREGEGGAAGDDRDGLIDDSWMDGKR